MCYSSFLLICYWVSYLFSCLEFFWKWHIEYSCMSLWMFDFYKQSASFSCCCFSSLYNEEVYCCLQCIDIICFIYRPPTPTISGDSRAATVARISIPLWMRRQITRWSAGWNKSTREKKLPISSGTLWSTFDLVWWKKHAVLLLVQNQH